jgi:chemotaxis protein methyltransferase CheR
MNAATLSDREFNQFSDMIYRIAGISLSPAKKPLVSSRLSKRLHEHRLSSYGEYFQVLSGGKNPDEIQIAVDLLTTNETYFFREPKHFDYLRDKILPQHPAGRAFRVWSAASSSGQEAYSIAMTLADQLGGQPWDIVASDISTRVLEKARSGQYPLEQAKHIPQKHLNDFCLKGIGSQNGTFLIERNLRSRVDFRQVNLNTTLPKLGEFDVVFLRNVMIYFDTDTKRQVVNRITTQLKSGGHLLIGHSESLNGVVDNLKMIQPSVYRKP